MSGKERTEVEKGGERKSKKKPEKTSILNESLPPAFSRIGR